MLTSSNINMHETSSSENCSLGISLPTSTPDKPSKPSVNIGINTSDKDKQGMAIATIGQGNINVADKENSTNIVDINRGPNQSLIVTHQSESGVNINLAIPIEILTNTNNYVNGSIAGWNAGIDAGVNLDKNLLNAMIDKIKEDAVANGKDPSVYDKFDHYIWGSATAELPDKTIAAVHKPITDNASAVANAFNDGYNQIGMGNTTNDPDKINKPVDDKKPGIVSEGGMLSNLANNVSGANSASVMHDVGISGHGIIIQNFTNSLGMPNFVGSTASIMWTIGSIPPYFLVNYLALTINSLKPKEPKSMLFNE